MTNNQKNGEKLILNRVITGWGIAMYIILVGAGVLATALFGIWWFNPAHVPQNFSHSGLHILDFILFVLLTYVVWYQIVNELFSWVIAWSMRHPRYMSPQVGIKVALLTAFVPSNEPIDVLEKTIQAMIAVEYPHDTWVLDEGNDEVVKALCHRYGAKHHSRAGQEKYNQIEGAFKAKTKAGNYNSWFDQHSQEYDIVAQHDVDFVPDKNFLMRTLGYFRDPAVAFVGTPQIYGNINDSWIVHGAAEQAYGFYGPIQKGLAGHDMSLFIGANHIMRVAAHNDIEGYSGHIVEDHLTGMKIYSKGWKSVYVPEVLAIGEGPSTWSGYFSQQMRWAFGLIDILFKHSPILFPKMRLKHAVNYFLMQQFYFYGIAQVLGIALLTLYFLFGIQSTVMDLNMLLILYPLLIIAQLVVFLWLQQFYIKPHHESGLHLRAKFLNLAAWPIYFMAFIGVLRGKRLQYAVTPKGKDQEDDTTLTMFLPHLVLGSITLAGIIVSFFTHNQAPQLLFWAIINTVVMFYFFFAVAVQKVLAWYRLRVPRRAMRLGTVLGTMVLMVLAVGFAVFIWRTPSVIVVMNSEAQEVQNVQQQFTPSPEVHIVQKGESLWRIAEKYYSNGSDWTRFQVKHDPNLIHPGERLVIAQN